jgi:hypothetical protein
VGEIAIDGTKMRAGASHDRNRGDASIVEEILDKAEQAARAEDERLGDAGGDELPEQLRTRERRRAALQAARERMQAEREALQQLAARCSRNRACSRSERIRGSGSQISGTRLRCESTASTRASIRRSCTPAAPAP